MGRGGISFYGMRSFHVCVWLRMNMSLFYIPVLCLVEGT